MMFLQNYFSVFIFSVVCLFLSIVIFGIPYFVSFKSIKKDKLSAYECGFNPYQDSKNEFEVKFYLIAILFIIFDLELSFLFPFIMCFESLHFLNFCSMLLFLLVLTVGFYYEWKKGALDWF